MSEPLDAEQEVPSPLAEFEQVERWETDGDGGMVNEWTDDTKYVLADKYDRLLNFTRQLLKERK